MKKNFIYATLSAIALVGAVSLSACSTSEEVEDVNPTFDGKAVKTQFTISLQEDVVKTRQSAATVQQAQTPASFRGMVDIVLYPFAVTGAAGEDPINDSKAKLGDAIQLKKIVIPNEVTLGTTENPANTIPASTTSVNSLTDVSNSVVYEDVSIPVGTGSFLFYGKAKDDGDHVINGALTMTGDEPSTIKFAPVQIYSGTTLTSTVGNNLATYLTQIAKAGGFNSETKKSGWEATTNAGLKELYDKFILLKTGSSLTAQAAVQDLYLSVWKNTDTDSKAIKDAIFDGSTTTYVTSVDGDGKLTFNESIGIKTNSTTGENNYFPGDIGLPDGAALLSYDDNTNEFTQVLNGNGNTGTDLTAKYADYVYPASLYYYCNSGIKTSTSSQKALYNGTNDWTAITGNTNFKGNTVGSSTRSVAILDQIQYAVGRLDSKIKCANATLYDKNGETYDASNGFTVTGILIGGQKEVNYDFTPSSSTTFYTIYDNVTKSLGELNFTTSESNPNYTLALETASEAKVYVAVELLNKGQDFQGADGVIPANCKFYLVGELDPTKGSKPTSAPALDQVFLQDYFTTANFTIQQGYSKTDTEFNATTGNTTGLGKAYNTIPDLRTPQLELGLSVNLKWEEGIKFDVTF